MTNTSESMRLNRSVALLAIVFLLVNCSKDETTIEKPVAEEKPEPEEPISEVYYTYITDCQVDTSKIDNFLIIHRENGDLLDYRSYEAGDILTFETLETEIPDKMTVTKLSVYKFQANGNELTQHSIVSETEVLKGTIVDNTCITTTTDPSPQNPLNGSFDISIVNIPASDNEFPIIDMSSSLDAGSSGFSGSIVNGLAQYDATATFRESGADFLISVLDRNNDLKYYFLENFEDGMDIILDYSEFNYFDSYIDIDVPSSYKTQSTVVEGFDNETDYKGYRQFMPGSQRMTPFKLGYLNRFEKFVTYLQIEFNDYGYRFLKAGSKPSDIVIPNKPMFSVQDESIQNFRFTTDLEAYSSIYSTWKTPVDETSNFGSWWSVSSNKGYLPIIGNLPDAITQLYPEINLEELEFSTANFKLNFNLNEEENISIYY